MNEFTLLEKCKVRTAILDQKANAIGFPLMTNVITYTAHFLLMNSRLLSNNKC